MFMHCTKFAQCFLSLLATNTNYIVMNYFQVKLKLKFKQILYCIPEIGNGWGSAVLNTQYELDFIKQGQRGFNNSVFYWIGGSADQPNATINYTDYIADNSGTT